MRRITLLGLAAAMMASVCGGCDTVDRIDSRIDCRQICSRYAECFDENYNVDECMTNCRNEANTDENYEAKVDSCENCIDDASCASATFGCADACVDVVP